MVFSAPTGELAALRWSRIDVTAGLIRIETNYVVRGGQRQEKETKTDSDRRLALDPLTSRCWPTSARRARPSWRPATANSPRMRSCSARIRSACGPGTRITLVDLIHSGVHQGDPDASRSIDPPASLRSAGSRQAIIVGWGERRVLRWMPGQGSASPGGLRPMTRQPPPSPGSGRLPVLR
jgi:hypothetical protein